MGEDNLTNKYNAEKIPKRAEGSGIGGSEPPSKAPQPISPADEGFYVIDYDANIDSLGKKIDGVGKYVLKPQKIEPREKDEIRALFYQMRDISASNRPLYFGSSRFYDKGHQLEQSRVFYKQAVFMKDFTDSFEGSPKFSSYYPDYQMMGYEQLRCYFTWRSKIRKGDVEDTSLSYAFIYIYELLNNIGVDSPQDGLGKLLAFWKAFRPFDNTVDRYVIRWLKDYHIYYNLDKPFRDFAEEQGLTGEYPKMADLSDIFELFLSISKYDARRSSFYLSGNQDLVKGCFENVIASLRSALSAVGQSFDGLVFKPIKKMAPWQPFKGALFWPWLEQSDREAVISESEIYICEGNAWKEGSNIAPEESRQLVSFIMKYMESVLRQISNYKHKISSGKSVESHAVISALNDAGLSLENIIRSAVIERYRELTKTVVSVDHEALSRIREEALATQERLTVPDSFDAIEPMIPPPVAIQGPGETALSPGGGWDGFIGSLSPFEKEALKLLLEGGEGVKKFADERGIMLEVLMEGINEKALETVGDSIIDSENEVYEDYIGQIKVVLG